MEEKYRPIWKVVGETAIGFSHIKKNMVNQDSIEWEPKSGNDLPIILAISDGHGSSKCFRSDKGSRFAVDTAVLEIKNYFKNYRTDDYSDICHLVQKEIPKILEAGWRKRVEDDLIENEFTEQELEAIEAKAGSKARGEIENYPYIAYGATLITVTLTESHVIYLQLGDGDILNVYEDGTAEPVPLPKDDRLFGNETTSLSGPRSENDYRSYIMPIIDRRPVMILASTDGYANSFEDDEGFLQIGPDYLKWAVKNGIEKAEGENSIASHLPTILSETSKRGSGDDITLGIIYDADVIERLKQQYQAEEKVRAAAVAQKIQETRQDVEKQVKPEPQKDPMTEKPAEAVQVQVRPEQPKLIIEDTTGQQAGIEPAKPEPAKINQQHPATTKEATKQEPAKIFQLYPATTKEATKPQSYTPDQRVSPPVNNVNTDWIYLDRSAGADKKLTETKSPATSKGELPPQEYSEKGEIYQNIQSAYVRATEWATDNGQKVVTGFARFVKSETKPEKPMVAIDESKRYFRPQRMRDSDAWVKSIEYLAIGNGHYKDGNYDEAIEAYLKSVEYCDDSHYAHNNLGCAYFLKDMMDYAEIEFVKAMIRDRGYRLASENRAIVDRINNNRGYPRSK